MRGTIASYGEIAGSAGVGGRPAGTAEDGAAGSRMLGGGVEIRWRFGGEPAPPLRHRSARSANAQGRNLRITPGIRSVALGAPTDAGRLGPSPGQAVRAAAHGAPRTRNR